MMNLNVVANVLPFLLSIFIIIVVTRFVWLRRKIRGGIPLTYAALAQLWWVTGYVLELLSDELAFKLFFDDIQWIGTLALPIAYLTFVTQYLEIEIKQWVWVGLIGIATLSLGLIYTNAWHGWVYRNPRYIDGDPFSIITYDYGRAIWFIYIFNYLILVYCAVLLLERSFSANRLQRYQIRLFLLALVIGMGGGLLSIYDVFGTVQRDYSPYYFILTDLIIIWALFRPRMLDLIPIARSKVVESVNDLVIVMDSQDRIVDFNASASEAFGWDRSTVIGQNFNAIAPAISEITNPYNQTDPDRTELTLATPAQGDRMYDLLVSPLFNHTGQVIGRVSVLRDITESKQIQATQRSQARLIHSISDAVFSVDMNYIIQTWNPAAEQIYGWTAEEALGKDWKEILQPEDNMFEKAKTMSSWAGKAVHHHKNGTPISVWSTINVFLGNHNEPVGMVAVNRDLRKHELLEKREMDLLREKERSFVLQEFISDVSHDVRTLLTIMHNALYLLEHEKNTAKQIETIGRQIGQLTKIFDDMLNMSRLDTLGSFSFERHDVNEMVTQVIQEKQALGHAKKLTIQFDHEADLPRVNCIPDYLPRAFANILDNAISYTPESGHIEVQTSRHQEHVHVKFIDTGTGISNKDMPYIFDRFYRGDQARSASTGSTGLGLSIARKIVELHHGTIEVETNLKNGSTFIVTLPIQ